MKNAYLLTTALVAAGALTTMVGAQSFSDRVIDTLTEQGFQTIEVEIAPTQTKFEAVRGNTKLEVVYDNETGQILAQETERFNGTVPGTIEYDQRKNDFVIDGVAVAEIDDDEDDADDDDDTDDRDEDRDGDDGDDGDGADEGDDEGDGDDGDDGDSGGDGGGSGGGDSDGGDGDGDGGEGGDGDGGDGDGGDD